MNLHSYLYLAPFESLAAFKKIQVYVDAQGYNCSEVIYIALRSELVSLIHYSNPTIQVIDIHDVPGLANLHEETSVQWIKIGEDLTKLAQQSPFIWANLIHIHTEYLLHFDSCQRVVKNLFQQTTPQQQWLVVAQGWLVGSHLDQFGHNIPWLSQLIIAAAHTYNRPVVSIGVQWPLRWSGQFIGEWLRLISNLWLFSIMSGLNVVLGIWQYIWRAWYTRSRTVLVVAPEIAAFSDLATLQNEVTQSGFSLISTNLGNMRWRFSSVFNDSFYLLQIAKQLLWPAKPATYIARLDPRWSPSRWITLLGYPLTVSGIIRIFYSFKNIRSDWRQLQSILKARVDWTETGTYTAVIEQTILLTIFNLWPEYMAWQGAQASIQSWWHPLQVVYSDGHSVWIRLWQWYRSAKTYEGWQVPHGYPNRVFPSYYYAADQYIAPTKLTQRHLIAQGIPDAKIRFVTSEKDHNNGLKKHISNDSPLIALFYAGIYAYWSFPDCHQVLVAQNVAIIKELRQKIPSATILLKSHPNGTSPDLISSILQNFSSTDPIHSESRGWSRDEQYTAIDIGISLAVLPSTPLITCIRLGIPFLLVSMYQKTASIPYASTARVLEGYPLFLPNMASTVELTASLLSDAYQYQLAQQKMLNYKKKIFHEAAPTLGQLVTSVPG